MSKASIWNWWITRGYSPEATAAIMGNIGPESGFLSNNVDDRCELSDAEYTSQVDKGIITRAKFIYDQLGYGYYQHTFWSRKAGLYDLCKQHGKSISNATCQNTWAEMELRTAEYSRVYKMLKSNASIEDMTREFMLYFEKPHNQSDEAIRYRCRYARSIYAEMTGTPVPAPEEKFWPPRIIDRNMSGKDVEVLQAILRARGYFSGAVDGIFGAELEAAVQGFQTAQELDCDGVVGNMTWTALLQR
jgi:murein L,D-transpeptidase YcbB/YkuD